MFCLCIPLSVSVSVSVSPSLLPPSVRPSLRPSLRPSVPPSVRLSVRPSVRPCLRPSLDPSVAASSPCLGAGRRLVSAPDKGLGKTESRHRRLYSRIAGMSLCSIVPAPPHRPGAAGTRPRRDSARPGLSPRYFRSLECIRSERTHLSDLSGCMAQRRTRRGLVSSAALSWRRLAGRQAGRFLCSFLCPFLCPFL